MQNKLSMSSYSEPDGHIGDKVKLVLDFSNYAIKKIWNVLKALIQGFIALKAEVDKLDINKLTNVPTSLNNLKTKMFL